jgi:DNA-binding XRE family transcriptional regulator
MAKAKPHMTPAEFRKIRLACGLSQVALGEAIDYTRVGIWSFESGARPIPKTVAIVMRENQNYLKSHKNKPKTGMDNGIGN